MKELNELVELAKKATPGKWWIDSHGHSMVAFSGEAGDVEVVFTTDNGMGPLVRHEDTGNLSHWRNDNDATFIAAANPQKILAIAEAFRAMEQDNLRLKSVINTEANRAEAAEAKLAELEKQEPAGTLWIDCTTSGTSYEFRPSGEVRNGQTLFTRSAPAVSLAELVPDEMTPKQASRSYGGQVEGFLEGFNACRAAILRNIEEAE